MTEKEAIEILETIAGVYKLKEVREAMNMAISALEESRKYRAIGIVEKCREAVEKQKAEAVMNGKLLKNFYGNPYCIKGDCPTCGRESIKSTDTDYCYVCGQHLKWDENLDGMKESEEE